MKRPSIQIKEDMKKIFLFLLFAGSVNVALSQDITPIPNNGTAGGTAPNDTSGTARRSVKTGDDTPIGVWVGILAAAIIVGGGAAYGVKRKKKK